MSFAITSPITGAAQTGFTSPTYTVVSDMAPTPQGKQVAVSALGGTQAGVTTHTVSSPFTLNFVRPPVYKTLGKPNPTTGLIKDVPRNTYKFIGRKGVLPLPVSRMRLRRLPLFWISQRAQTRLMLPIYVDC